MRVFLIRGLVAIAWAVVFAAVSDSLTTGVTVGAGILVVIYPLIDVVASLIDARSERGSARRVLGQAGHCGESGRRCGEKPGPFTHRLHSTDDSRN